MAAAVGKYAANKMLRSEMKKYANKGVSGENDPYFAFIEDPRKPGKVKKVKKLAPSYIPEHDAAILNAFRRRAYRLDMGLFNAFGIRFGWEAVIGIIPIAGDAIGVSLALLLVKQAMKVEGGLDTSVLIRMLINIAIDFVVGLVPILGDLADAAFKANTKNLRLLERSLDKKYRPKGNDQYYRNLSAADRKQRNVNRKSGIYHPQDLPPATAFEDFDSDGEQVIAGEPIQSSGAAPQQPMTQSTRQPATQPAPQSAPQNRGIRGWFSGSPRDRRPDVEMGHAAGQETGTVRR